MLNLMMPMILRKGQALQNQIKSQLEEIAKDLNKTYFQQVDAVVNKSPTL